MVQAPSDRGYAEVVESLPGYLRSFCVEQGYDRYTAEHQAVWRYVMRAQREELARTAHPAYVRGLAASGLGVERIPRIEDMNRQLAALGWRAVVVDGFIPPAIFMEFQAHRVLPISADMRTLDHIVYTPAPDILHEAAGHAPILADPEYADFLERVGRYGALALSSRPDDRVYRAVRALSIVKEHPNAAADEIAASERELESALAEQAAAPASEAARFARFHWWTVEYGLVGAMAEPVIYGAGLLSSLLESRHALSPAVERRPLSLECLDQGYDITTMQPILYVARDFAELFEHLETLADDMAFRRGGYEGIVRAASGASLASARFDNGVELSGTFADVVAEDRAGSGWFALREPLGFKVGEHLEFAGEATLWLPSGCPRGLFDRAPAHGECLQLPLAGGAMLRGTVSGLRERDGAPVLAMLDDAVVTDGGGAELGRYVRYPLPLGRRITSVYGGPADRSRYAFEPPATSARDQPVCYTATQRRAETLYAEVRALREGAFDLAALRDVDATLSTLTGDKWLLLLEIYELLVIRDHDDPAFTAKVRRELEALHRPEDVRAELVCRGIDLATMA